MRSPQPHPHPQQGRDGVAISQPPHTHRRALSSHGISMSCPTPIWGTLALCWCLPGAEAAGGAEQSAAAPPSHRIAGNRRRRRGERAPEGEGAGGGRARPSSAARYSAPSSRPPARPSVRARRGLAGGRLSSSTSFLFPASVPPLGRSELAAAASREPAEGGEGKGRAGARARAPGAPYPPPPMSARRGAAKRGLMTRARLHRTGAPRSSRAQPVLGAVAVGSALRALPFLPFLSFSSPPLPLRPYLAQLPTPCRLH